MFVQQRSNHMTKIQTSFVFKSRIFNGLSQCETVVMEPPWTSHIAKERSHFESSRPSDGNCTLLGVDNETNLGASINYVDRIVKIFDPPPPFVDKFVK